jgi:hypothetical protein
MAETRWTFIEDLPRLEKGTLRRANAFAPGTKTLWQWGAGARASLTEAIAVPGGLLLKDFAGETTVLSRPWYLVCPSCHRENRYLLLDRARRRWNSNGNYIDALKRLGRWIEPPLEADELTPVSELVPAKSE